MLKRCIRMASSRPTATPITQPIAATPRLNSIAANTADATFPPMVADSSGCQNRSMIDHTCGIDTSSARGSSRIPKYSPPSTGPTTL